MARNWDDQVAEFAVGFADGIGFGVQGRIRGDRNCRPVPPNRPRWFQRPICVMEQDIRACVQIRIEPPLFAALTDRKGVKV